MTIEKYLKSEAEYIERMLSEEDDLEGGSYLEGKRDAYREILDKLPEMEHEVTLRETLEMCQSHFGKDGCKKCPMHTSVCYCSTFGVPAYWEPDEIQKRMREAKER